MQPPQLPMSHADPMRNDRVAPMNSTTDATVFR